MSMTKHGKSGSIEEVVEDGVTKEVPNIEWSDNIIIRDVLEVPTRSEVKIDVNLDEDEGDEFAVRV